jgi:hypothetical protein
MKASPSEALRSRLAGALVGLAVMGIVVHIVALCYDTQSGMLPYN